MLITRTSMFTGKQRTMDLDITEEQYNRWLDGELVQKAFPNLNADEREFIMTGVTPEEWDSAFPPEDEWDDDNDDEAAY